MGLFGKGKDKDGGAGSRPSTPPNQGKAQNKGHSGQGKGLGKSGK